MQIEDLKYGNFGVDKAVLSPFKPFEVLKRR
jgi:hypothetical protein